MNFIDYKTLPFNNLSDSTEVLLSAEMSTWVNAVNICNLSDDNIRLNLQFVRSLNVDEPTYTPIRQNVLIQKNESLDLIKDLKIQLENGDNLLCFSNGYNEKFSCLLCYTELNDLNAVE